MIVRLLSKAASRILAELRVLSKDINLELISSLKYIFCGFIDPQKFFNKEKFPDYSR